MKRSRVAALCSILTACVVSPFAACAGPGNAGDPPDDDDGAPDASLPEVETDAPPPEEEKDASSKDAEALRCSGDFCLVDLPSPEPYGFSKWTFSGVVYDPSLGAWATANGALGVDDATAQILRFDETGWTPVHAPALEEGTEQRSIRLVSLSADGAGNLLAVGATVDRESGAIVRGDGVTFTTAPFDAPLEAAWFASAEIAWVAGRGGVIHRGTPDGEWISESGPPGSDFVAIWGSGPDDVYVGGTAVDDFQAYGLLGHRTVVADAGPSWTFSTFPELQPTPFRDQTIMAGVALPGARFWAAPDVLARGSTEGGEPIWVADPFEPRAAINAFWARAADDIWAVGDVGRVYHFDGTSWKDLLLVFNGAPLVANLTGIAGTSKGELFIVGDGVALHRRAP